MRSSTDRTDNWLEARKPGRNPRSCARVRGDRTVPGDASAPVRRRPLRAPGRPARGRRGRGRDPRGASAATSPTSLVCFASPHFVGDHRRRRRSRSATSSSPRVLLGATAVGVVGGAHEVEDGPALSVFAACLPDARLTPVALGLEHTPDGAAVIGWPDLDGAPSTLVLLADPFTFPPTASSPASTRTVPTLAGDRGPGVGGPRPRRQPARARRPSRVRRGAVGVFLDGVDGAHGGVPGLPADRAAATW